MQFFTNIQTWIDLLILTILEIVLGIDNIVFIILASNRLPKTQQVLARRAGLVLAMVMRLMLLGLIFWLAQLTTVLFTLGPFGFSVRNIVEFLGGVFLVIKAGQELYEYINQQGSANVIKEHTTTLWLVLLQIVLLDVIFSLDSVITAVAIAEQYAVMAAAIVIAIVVMMVASEPVNYFIHKYTRVKLLALLLILLVGGMLICHGLSWYISEWYLYMAIVLLGVVILPPWKRWLIR